MKKSEAEQIRELGDRLAAINEKPDTIEDAIKRPALKILGRCSNHEFTLRSAASTTGNF